MYQLTKESAHKQILAPTGQAKVPVVFHVSDDLLPPDATIDQLAALAADDRVFHHIAALTDVHSKPGRKNPTGTAVATDDYILPQLIDTAPNCGMRLFTTPFGGDDLTEKQIDDLFRELVYIVPTKTYVGTPLPYWVVMDVCRRGSQAILEYYSADTGEISKTSHSGNMFEKEEISEKAIHQAIPDLFLRIAQLRMGILGAAGNHFLDLMKVEEILQPEIAQKLGVKNGQYVFLMHTGSGMFGQYSSYFYMPKKKEHLSQKLITELAKLTFLKKSVDWHKQLKYEIPAYENRKEYFGIKADSDLGKNFLVAHRASANHGFANRALLQLKVQQTITKLFGKKVQLPLIYDMTHISIQPENHFGKDVWVHRNGLVRAYGPGRMQSDPLYSQTGEPIFAPSSMSTPAYLGVAMDGNESTFYSAPHGTGKAKDKTSDVPADREALMEKMKSRGVKLYNAQSKGIINQDASHYKDIGAGLAGLEANGIMKPVAKMMPVAVLMA